MPFWGLQKQLGIDVDSFLLRQSMPQPHGQAALCHAFEREWVECGHGLGQTRARRECQLEYEDFMECMKRTKLRSSSSIRTQDKILVRKRGWKPKSISTERPESPKIFEKSLKPGQRLRTILEQRDRMIKQGKYTPPEHHMGKEEPRP